MTNPKTHPRKTPRAQWINYDVGLYFITICTKNRIHYFGDIHNGKMILSEIGEIVKFELSNPEIHHAEIHIPLFVVMPNHVHAIIGIKSDNGCYNQTEQRNPNPSLRTIPDMARHVPTLSKYIASLKSVVTRKARMIESDFNWQNRYHDHLIRNIQDGNNIVDYIINNPLNWDKDCFARE